MASQSIAARAATVAGLVLALGSCVNLGSSKPPAQLFALLDQSYMFRLRQLYNLQRLQMMC